MKTHLAVALAHEALMKRYTVYFITAYDLVQTLHLAHQNHTIKQKLRTYTKPDLLIIDEIGYRKMDDAAAHFFFQIVSERYERIDFPDEQQIFWKLGRHFRRFHLGDGDFGQDVASFLYH